MNKQELLVKVCTPLDHLFRLKVFNDLFFLYARRKLNFGSLPKILKIEPTNRCNAACIFCPHDQMTRSQGIMSSELYEKIIKDAPDHGIFEIEFVHMGETLLDPDIFSKIKMAKAFGMRTQLVSNGSLFSSKKIAEMCDSQLDILKISFEGYSEKIFNELRPRLDFKTISDNIRAIMEYKAKYTLNSPFVVIRCVNLTHYTHEMNSFVSEWRKIVDDIEVLPLHNWTDQTQFQSSTPINCFYPWTHMTILQDGRVVPCTVEWKGETVVGDLNYQTISEVWHGPQMRKLREELLNRNIHHISLCNHCDIPYSENRLNFLNQLVGLYHYPHISILRKV